MEKKKVNWIISFKRLLSGYDVFCFWHHIQCILGFQILLWNENKLFCVLYISRIWSDRVDKLLLRFVTYIDVNSRQIKEPFFAPMPIWHFRYVTVEFNIIFIPFHTVQSIIFQVIHADQLDGVTFFNKWRDLQIQQYNGIGDTCKESKRESAKNLHPFFLL